MFDQTKKTRGLYLIGVKRYKSRKLQYILKQRVILYSPTVVVTGSQIASIEKDTVTSSVLYIAVSGRGGGEAPQKYASTDPARLPQPLVLSRLSDAWRLL